MEAKGKSLCKVVGAISVVVACVFLLHVFEGKESTVHLDKKVQSVSRQPVLESSAQLRRLQDLVEQYSEVSNKYSEKSDPAETLRIEAEVQEIEKDPAALLNLLLNVAKPELELALSIPVKQEYPGHGLGFPIIVAGCSEVIAAIYKNRIKYLSSKMTTESQSSCLIILLSLRKMGPDAKDALDALVLILEGSDPMLQSYAASVIVQCGRAALPYVKRIALRFDYVDSNIRNWIISIIEEVDPDDIDGFPLLVRGITDLDPVVRNSATSTLALVREEKHRSVARRLLSDRLGDEDTLVRDAAAGGLMKLNSSPESVRRPRR